MAKRLYFQLLTVLYQLQDSPENCFFNSQLLQLRREIILPSPPLQGVVVRNKRQCRQSVEHNVHHAICNK